MPRVLFLQSILTCLFCLRGFLLATDPEEMPRVDVEIVGTSNEELVEQAKKERIERIERLQAILRQAEEKIRTKRNDLRQLVVALGSDDPVGSGDATTLNDAQQSILQKSRELSTDLARIRSEQSKAQSRLHALVETSKRTQVVESIRNQIEKAESRSTEPTKPENSEPGDAKTQRYLTLKLAMLTKQESRIVNELKVLEKEATSRGGAAIDVEMRKKEIQAMEPLIKKITQEIERIKLELPETHPKQETH